MEQRESRLWHLHLSLSRNAFLIMQSIVNLRRRKLCLLSQHDISHFQRFSLRAVDVLNQSAKAGSAFNCIELANSALFQSTEIEIHSKASS